MHSIARTQKYWQSCPRRVNADNKNTPSMHQPRRRNVATSMVGLIKKQKTKKKPGHMSKNLIQNGEPQRHSWARQKKRRRFPFSSLFKAVYLYLSLYVFVVCLFLFCFVLFCNALFVYLSSSQSACLQYSILVFPTIQFCSLLFKSQRRVTCDSCMTSPVQQKC